MKQIQLKHRPQGVPIPDDFEIVSGPVPVITNGEALTETVRAFLGRSGGVGVAAAQIARLLGVRRLIGSIGSEEKADYLKVQGLYNDVVNYHAEPIMDGLKRVAPEGIDHYFDNVGGEHLEAAIAALKKFGRIAWCGAIAQYNDAGAAYAPSNLYEIHNKSLRLEGFWVTNYTDLQGEYEKFMVPHPQAGRAKDVLTVMDGLETAIPAFIGLVYWTQFGQGRHSLVTGSKTKSVF